MSKPNTKTPSPKNPRDVDPEKEPVRPPPPAEELPIVESMGLAKAPQGGWVPVLLHTQGDRVIEREILDARPEPRSVALERLKLSFVRRFMQGLK